MPMEVPSEVMVHCDALGLKGARGHLLQISPHGYFEVNLVFGDKQHRVLLPISRTVLISSVPEESTGLVTDVER
jgi:hypothetical protein